MRNLRSLLGMTVVTGWFSLLGFIASPVQGQCTFGWKPAGGLWGLNGPVNAAVEYDDGSGPALYVGFNGTIAGDTFANGIARWNGIAWSSLGSGMGGAYPSVYCLTVYHGELIAGGTFTTAGGVSANGVARWNGASWSPLGAGSDNGVAGPNGFAVYALAVYHEELIAGGWFSTAGGVSVNRIAKWNGTSWSPLGSEANNGVGGGVSALAVYGDELIAAGQFYGAGGVGANNIARWDGASWSALGEGDTNGVYGVCFPDSSPAAFALAVYNDHLIVGGWFTTAGGEEAGGIAEWNGTTWSPLGGDAGNGVDVGGGYGVHALFVDGGHLIAGGSFNSVGGVNVNNIAEWSGTAWSTLGSGAGDDTHGRVSALTAFNGALIAAGQFTSAGGAGVSNIAQWSGGSWSALGSTTSHGVQVGDGHGVLALTVFNNALIAGGFFTTAGGIRANDVARWNGSAWSTLGNGAGNGVSGPYSNPTVCALAVYKDELIAGGWFDKAGGVSVNNIARWNGTSWSSLGSGADNGVNEGILALTVYDGRLIAAGYFTRAGGIDVNYIAQWDGAHWSALAGGVSNQLTNNPAVDALTVYGGNLIAGGWFTHAGGGMARNIAQWNGTAWSALSCGIGDGVDSEDGVRALLVHNGRLIAGGGFSVAGGIVAHNIAEWNGGSWSSLGVGPDNGVNDGVSALAVHNGELVAGGWFDSAGGVGVSNIARWDGASWSSLGGADNGTNGPVAALTVYNADLVVGGDFYAAGGQVSVGWARWGSVGPFVAADFNQDCHVDVKDFRIFTACATGPAVPYNPAALPPGCTLIPDAGHHIAVDFNADGDVDMIDFAAFQRCLSGTGVADPTCADD